MINKTNTTIIFINQLREKIGVMFGNPETTTGGRALKFFASMRIDVRKVESIKSGDQILGSRTRAKIVKNKVAPPFKQAEFDIMYGQGISRSGDVLDCAVDAKVIEKAGSWYSFEGSRIGQGRENVKKFLEDNPDVMDRVEGKLLDGLKKDDGESEEQQEEAAAAAAGRGRNAGPDMPEMDIDDIIIDEDGVIIE